MDIPSTVAAPSQKAPSPGPDKSQSPEASTTISSDFDTFLQLLTAQIRNQDPLDPMKSEEFAVQLATFSNVEQSVRSNDLLEAILASGGGNEFTAMSSWIGRDVRAAMPVQFSGDPISLDPPLPKAGSRQELVVFNETGAEVYRRQVSSTGAPLDWAGTTTAGPMAGTGIYNFAVESFEAGTLVASEAVPAYARVSELRSGTSGPILAFAGGVEIAGSAVTAIREAGGQ
ncbi:flagellar hook assembly protein FlgD [Maribius pontilimi]|uniref:Basal-body rod modification protein FlgD n=1 Tax=Palleronia pontilimi TaxID=1964209 RepID=A0A934ICJ9_9RHOB|nr:flagellar hook assembly protein FlgD [Palleronia pontilimi]